jgi:hypothetical protein
MKRDALRLEINPSCVVQAARVLQQKHCWTSQQWHPAASTYLQGCSWLGILNFGASPFVCWIFDFARAGQHKK